MNKKMVAIAVIVAAVCVVIYFVRRTSIKPEGGDKPIAGLASTPQVAAEGKVESLPGYEVEVGSELEGKIADIFVEEGSTVKKGAIIAQMENREIKAKLREAEAALSAAKAKLREVESGAREEEIKAAEAELARTVAADDFEKASIARHRELQKKGIISREDLEAKEMSLKTSSANARKASENKALLEKGPKPETIQFYAESVRQAGSAADYVRRILDKTAIIAPISGKVVRKYLQRGEMVSKDVQPNILAVADVDKIRINAEVDETDIGKVKVGDQAEITCYAYPGKVFGGVVREISDYAGIRKFKPNNPARNTDMKIVQVKIALSEKTELINGMTVDVKIVSGK